MSRRVLSTFVVLIGCAESPDLSPDLATEESELNAQQISNPTGVAETYSLLGSLPELMASNAFFKDMGTTGRTCNSCHSAAGGWTPSAADDLWRDTNGTDPLFMFTHDVGRCPDSPIAKKSDRRRAMSLLLDRGLTRSAVTIQPTAEFEVLAVDDPYDCSGTTLTSFFNYRKPNPSVGVSQKTSVTWAPGPQPDMRAALNNFVVGATRVHGLTTYTATLEEQTQGADFMLFTYFAQIRDRHAGRLDAGGARGGPVHLAEQDWFVGINHASTGPTTKKVFDIYDAWIGASCGHHDDDDADHCDDDHGDCRKMRRRGLIAEGQELFNFRENANGGTCSGCHNSPNVGTRSVYQLFDIGTVDLPDPGLTKVTLRNKATGATRVVTNLGRGAATGLWADVGKMAVPPLRGLSSRAPYFHAGQARNLRAVVDHYDSRFNFDFTPHERRALVAFLESL